jgi:Zn-dependent protease with chaperone function
VTYPLLAATITLTAFAATLAAVSAILGASWTVVWRRLARYAPSTRARMLASLRLVPAAAGVIVAAGVVLPLFTWFEPRDTRETIARTLVACAAAGGLIILWAIARAAAARRATTALARGWRRRGRALAAGGVRLPVFAIDEPFPIVAVVGIRRPALFVAERVLAACTPAELAAIVAHEEAHAAARDNLWRLMLRAAPFLVPPSARARMDRAWDEAAEQAADARASARAASTRFDLAAALVRVSRLIPSGACAPAGVSAFHDGGPIASRVRRLLDPPAERTLTARPIVLSLTGAGVVFLAAVTGFAPILHRALEFIVRLP